MPDTMTRQHSVRVEYGYVENNITVEPPISREQLEHLIGEGVIHRTITDDYEPTGEPGEKTCIPFGRLILGFAAMDRATLAYAQDIRTALTDLAT